MPVDRNALISEVTLDYAIGSSLTIGPSYSGQFGDRASDHAVKGHLQLSL